MRASDGRVSNGRVSRRRVPYAGGHLIGVHLTGVHLIGVHLTGVHLIGVDLTGVHLISVHLTAMHLTGAYPIPLGGKCDFFPPLSHISPAPATPRPALATPPKLWALHGARRLNFRGRYPRMRPNCL